MEVKRLLGKSLATNIDGIKVVRQSSDGRLYDPASVLRVLHNAERARLSEDTDYIEGEVIVTPTRKTTDVVEFTGYHPQDFEPEVSKENSDIISFVFLCAVIIIVIPLLFKFAH